MSRLNEINVQIFFLKQSLQPTTIALSSASFYWFYLAVALSSWYQLVLGCSSSFQKVSDSFRNEVEPPGTSWNNREEARMTWDKMEPAKN